MVDIYAFKITLVPKGGVEPPHPCGYPDPNRDAAARERLTKTRLASEELTALGLVPKGGVEPPRPCGHMVLNHARLPFRHFGMCDCREILSDRI